jgi:hypothetical protein
MKESSFLRQYRKRWLVLTPERLLTFSKKQAYSTSPTEARQPAHAPALV